MQDALHAKLNEIRRVDYSKSTTLKKNVETFIKIIDEFKWLTSESGNYYTIDTLAKKYFLTQKSDGGHLLKRLKNCLITYFALEQYVNIPSKTEQKFKENSDYNFNKNVTDKRYDSFVAAIAQKSDELIELNSSIKILSWNYDIQFELCLQRFLNKIFHLVQDKYQILPNKSILNGNAPTLNLSQFCMVKMNGNAIWDEDLSGTCGPHTATIFDRNKLVTDNDELLGYCIEKYAPYINNTHGRYDVDPSLHFNFAWEYEEGFSQKYNLHESNLQCAEQIAAETEILVVIGYSFPIFNRKIDKKLFKGMGKLKKVYIQDREPEKIKSTMQNAFEKLQEKKIVNKFNQEVTLVSGDINQYMTTEKVSFQLESNINQFVIPFELNL